VGWNLDLGKIQCSTRFGIPDYGYQNCKTFELDDQLLTRDGTTNTYHSSVETFQRIEYQSASQTWEVTDPNGTIYRYGVGADARVFSGADTAQWLLSEIQDPFGNQIFITYDDSIDPGTRYPSLITYGAYATKSSGKRQVEFVFGDRPDPIHDYAGGIERRLSKRLTDIKVLSYGTLVRRYAFGYDLPDLSYTTGRSRLSWVQQFGADCEADVELCSGLRRQEFEYTDPNDDGTTAQFSKFTRDENYVVPFAGNAWIGEPPVRIGDVNGDGLPDLIKGGIYFGSGANIEDETRVEINTGFGFALDAAWTAALRRLEVERPRADFSQIAPDFSGGGGQDVLHWNTDTAGIFAAQYSTVVQPIDDTPPSATTRPEARTSRGAIANTATGAPLPGWIEAHGRLFLTDVDADGLVDIVVSVRLSGVDKVLDSAGNPISPTLVERVPGRFVPKVYRNTGDPVQGWIEDDQLAKGLPPFGIVLFESGYGAESRIPFGLGNGTNGGFEIISPQVMDDPCSVRGLNGWWSNPAPSITAAMTPDVCVNLVDLDPRFQDFNGDGYLDLLVLELDDSEALHQGIAYFRGDEAPPLANNFAESKAWLQNPDPSAGQDRWVRAPEYDLPNVLFGTTATGGLETPPLALPFPFAHSQPQLIPGNDKHPNCPGPGDLMPNWEFCAPLSHNQNLGVKLVDLNRDGLTDVIWSRYHSGTNVWQSPDFPLIAQGVLLNTGTGWCSSIPEMAAYVESHCGHAAIYNPPANSYPDLPAEPSGFAFANSWYPGSSTGYLTDLNADGWLDYIQAHTTKSYPGNKAWLFNPSGASEPNTNMWVRDPRYDLDIDYNYIYGVWADSLAFAVLDINGDGAADVIGDDLRGPNNTDLPQAFISESRHSDLLRLVRNGAGGQIAISYESAIIQRDPEATGLELQAAIHASTVGEALSTTAFADIVRWTSRPVVSEVRIAGLNREPDPTSPIPGFGPPTTYRYAHPRFCLKSRSDLGFRVVEHTRIGGEILTSKFYQAHGRAGKTSSIVVADNGVDMHLYEEYWEIQPQIPALIPGSIDHPDVHVGRLAEMRSMNLYGDGVTGARLIRTLYYDDNYGYNFVEKIVEARPTGTLVNIRLPTSDTSNSIFSLVAEQKIFDHEASSFLGVDFMKHTLMAYQLGRPSSITDMVRERESIEPATTESRSLSYDVFGNLTKQTVHAATGDRVTDYCYDGDHSGGEDADWCPNFGQNSHSVRIGMQDTLGGISTFTPDSGTGEVIETASSYTDEPLTRTTLDTFGRPIESFLHDGMGWLKTTETVYDDLSIPPVTERYEFPHAASQNVNAVWSSLVSDGFGGVWKDIAETPTGFVTTLTYHAPASHRTQTSLPISCADSLCAGLDGDIQPHATRTTNDAIGRPIRNDTPDGFSIFEYFPLTKTAGPGPTGDPFDGILEKNGKGDLIQRAMDRDRIGWVAECGNATTPDTTDIGAAGCTGSELTETYYTYEATGEISTIYDARATSPFNDPNHYVRYHYDTLGRVLQIDDPALAGSGFLRTSYDTFGNIQNVTNARSQQRTHLYDELNRPIGITTPTDETGYTILYRENEKQSSGDASDDYARTLIYDGLGRVQQEEMAVRNAFGLLQNFLTSYRYDLIGRITEVVHPAMHYKAGKWTDTIVRYEYDRGYLNQICDLGEAESCDSAATKYVDLTVFDTLGRPTSFTFPGGVRSFEYTSDTHRISKDEFTAPSYQYTRSYTDYDGVGNILAITGSETASQALDMNERYVYDQRNRIRQWTKEGVGYAYEYDDLGNLTLHSGEEQIYDDPGRPHAIQRRNIVSSSPIHYSYDEDGNVESILGGPTPQYFKFDSANRIICLSESNTRCETRVAYDVNGKRVAEYPSGGRTFNAYIGDAFLWEEAHASTYASVEITLDAKRIALKRFVPKMRASTASLFAFRVPLPWIEGGIAGLGLLLLALGIRNGTFVLVRLHPSRAAVALGASASLFLPSIMMAGCGPGALAPAYFWEISDSLGTGMVLIDQSGNRVRHQVFTPFGRIHAEEGPGLRTFYAGHRRNDDTGMFYMQARWYDPGAGRFLSIDPLIRSTAVPQSANPYSYTENNPVNGADPTGMCLWDCPDVETMPPVTPNGSGGDVGSSSSGWGVAGYGAPGIAGIQFSTQMSDSSSSSSFAGTQTGSSSNSDSERDQDSDGVDHDNPDSRRISFAEFQSVSEVINKEIASLEGKNDRDKANLDGFGRLVRAIGHVPLDFSDPDAWLNYFLGRTLAAIVENRLLARIELRNLMIKELVRTREELFYGGVLGVSNLPRTD